VNYHLITNDQFWQELLKTHDYLTRIHLEWYIFVRGGQDLANYLNYHTIHGLCVAKAKDNMINDNNVLQKMKRYFDIIEDNCEVLQYFKIIGIKIEGWEKPSITTTSP